MMQSIKKAVDEALQRKHEQRSGKTSSEIGQASLTIRERSAIELYPGDTHFPQDLATNSRTFLLDYDYPDIVTTVFEEDIVLG